MDRKGTRNISGALVGLCAAILVWSSVAFAQVTTGTILGTVKDQSGAVLPGATVTATNVETGISRTATTGSRGEYRLQALGLGSYEITSTMAGFQTANRGGVTLSMTQEAVIDFTLSVGNVTEQVTVTGEAPLIETTTATMGSLVDPKQMREIPLNARSFIELVPLQAGAVYAESGEQSATKGFGVKLAITGTRYNANAFLLDGANINDAAGSSGSAAGTMAGVETVREFKVITNAYDAEYGQHVGGVVSAVTKSGTNDFHGALFEFFRNDKLDAPSFDDNRERAGEKSPYRRNQFGGNLGGPIKQNSTFFFGSLELLREAVGSALSANVPGPELRQGCVPVAAGAVRDRLECYDASGKQWFVTQSLGLDQDLSGLVRAKESQTAADSTAVLIDPTVNPKVKRFMDTYPIANTPCSAANCAGFWQLNGQGTFTRPQSDITNQNFWTARVDQRLSDSDSIFGRYTDDVADKREPGFDTATISETKNKYLTVEHTRIYTPTLLGRTNLSFVRTALALYDTSMKGLGLTDYELPACPSCTEHPDSFAGNDVPGILTTGVGNGWGGSNTNPKQHNLNTFQFQEGITYSVGRQNIKMGGNFQRNQFNQRSDFHPGGTYSFSAAGDFITNTVNTFSVTTPGSDNIRGWRQNIAGLYIQDDISLRPGLTINVGLRYEFISIPTEVNGKIATLRNQSDRNFYSFNESQTDVGDPYFLNPSLKNLAPRIGFAWTPFASGKTAVRGGVGIFHDQLTSNFYITSGVRVAPFYSVAVLTDRIFRVNTGQPIDFPDAFRTQTGLLKGGAQPQIDGFQWDVEQPTTYKYSFTIQQQLMADTTLEVGYAGTRGVHNVRGNLVLNSTPVREIPELGGRFILIEQDRTNPNWERMRWRFTDGTSWYHGLLVSASKRYSRGFQVNSSYTYSKSLDDSSTWTGSTDFGAGDSQGFRKEHWWGRSAFDVTHSWSASVVWDLPGANMGGVAGKLLGGWNIGSIVRAFSGNPTTFSATRPSIGRLGNGGLTGNGGTSNCTAAQTAAGCVRYQVSFVDGASISMAPGVDGVKINPGSRDKYYNSADLVWPQNFVNNAALINYPGAGPTNGSRPTGALVGMGNMGRNTITIPGLLNFDFTLRKDTVVPMLGEAGKLEFRAEFFNAMNHTRLPAPDTSVFDAQGVLDANAGTITGGRGNPRQIQLALRLVF